MPCIICSGHAWCSGHSLPVNICTATVESHAPYLCLFSWYYIYSIHLHQLVQHTSHTKIKTYFILQSLPWFWKTTHLQSDVLMLSTVQWHNLRVPITCLNLQSHDTISCQTCCYLIFWNFLVYPSEAENSKYGTRNTPTTGSTNGMNKDVPLILNNNNAVGVTDEVREITWFYKQR